MHIKKSFAISFQWDSFPKKSFLSFADCFFNLSYGNSQSLAPLSISNGKFSIFLFPFHISLQQVLARFVSCQILVQLLQRKAVSGQVLQYREAELRSKTVCRSFRLPLRNTFPLKIVDPINDIFVFDELTAACFQTFIPRVCPCTFFLLMKSRISKSSSKVYLAKNCLNKD